jgi:hypothetical protein
MKTIQKYIPIVLLIMLIAAVTGCQALFQAEPQTLDNHKMTQKTENSKLSSGPDVSKRDYYNTPGYNMSDYNLYMYVR